MTNKPKKKVKYKILWCSHPSLLCKDCGAKFWQGITMKRRKGSAVPKPNTSQTAQ